MDICIRGVEKEDLNQVTEVEAVCFPAAEAAGREAFKSRIEAFADSFFVAETEERIIGFVNGCVTDEKIIRDEMFADSSLHNRDGAWQSIFGLDVLPEYRRQGIAEKLMRHLIETARQRGKTGLTLTCKEHMIHYYEKFGYVNIGLSASKHGGATWYDMILEF